MNDENVVNITEKQLAEAADDRGPVFVTDNMSDGELMKHLADEFDRLDEARGAINDEKSKLRKSLKARGYNVKAFEAALRYRRLDDTKSREVFDRTYMMTRRELGLDLQRDLFDGAEPDE